MKNPFLFLLLFLYVHLACSQSNLNREFRGVWVATVNNIDWPSKKGLSTADQKKEVLLLLDRFQSLNLNAVIFQIRPVADAFYNSKYEPWSSYLSGTNDRSPAPYYDPLGFIIEETHKRGMEFHAWLNPYRAMIDIHEFQSNPFKLTYEKSEWFVNYGKNKYFNPGIPDVRSYTNKIVKDIVQNYDIDAIHFDDYFYPYKIAGEVFDDDRAFETYGGEFYPENRDDWRRNNVNKIIRELNHTIKSIKPWVQFGISPFGVWRNKSDDPRGSDTQAGQTNYDHLYADILLWIDNKWIDYILPQAYWHIGHERADYQAIVKWWAENSAGTNLYIGHGIYRMGSKDRDPAWSAKNPTQIEKQLNLNKSIQQIKGSVYFSAKSFVQNPMKVDDILLNKYYSYPAVAPIVNTDVKYVPEAVEQIELVRLKNKSYRLQWKALPEHIEKQAVRFLVYQFDKGVTVDLNKANHRIALTGESQIDLDRKTIKNAGTFVIQAVSRNNNLSLPKSFQVK